MEGGLRTIFWIRDCLLHLFHFSKLQKTTTIAREVGNSITYHLFSKFAKIHQHCVGYLQCALMLGFSPVINFFYMQAPLSSWRGKAETAGLSISTMLKKNPWDPLVSTSLTQSLPPCSSIGAVPPHHDS
jgi:hypothetical protein